MQKTPVGVVANVCILLFGIASVANAHDHVEGGNMNMGDTAVLRPAILPSGDNSDLQTYFQYGEHSGLMAAHIALMTIAWLFILPIGVLLSIARSRYRLPTQSAFLVANGVAVFLATIYNASTPDLYPNNAHHKLGWIITWVVIVQVLVGVVTLYAGRKEVARSEERGHFIPISAEVMAEHHRLHNEDDCRFSGDSGQGTERNTESLRSHSIASTSPPQLSSPAQENEEEYFVENPKLVLGGKLHGFLSSRIPGLLSSKALRIFQFLYDAVDRLILLIGWAIFLTGWVTYGGFFTGRTVFSGLAHFIKGSVFFWFGIVSLGRWAGCFAEIGWAWNTATPKKGSKFSAEFVESFMIFLYGATNIFLEHLAAWGKAWTAQDLEHLSITVMFIGGGLCGMVIESKLIRSLLNATKRAPQTLQSRLGNELEQEQAPPESYRFSMNPLPALVTFLVGIMMSSHHQESMISTMIHKQWGTLLVGAAFSRVATYLIFYVKPPTSTLPGRPPTELITSFCLLAGGAIFMVSARDTVNAMESNGLDAMFIFTVAMGLITFLMAWVIVVVAIKGWAVRMENARGFAYRRVGLGE
ncbi:hypothetical protein HYALB_00001306 [Hymenoscyphus albidus]|uniref:Integral membrane protein n=1 Tax=Hymenoscyphus albidus TaxID=595503 RepID=A0A9N9Q464_9HELO|nr:hypothetical protein HYALB_00001306 [Hymenoscyphus albidus]